MLQDKPGDIGTAEEADVSALTFQYISFPGEGPERHEKADFVDCEGADELLNVGSAAAAGGVLALHLDERRFKPERVLVGVRI